MRWRARLSSALVTFSGQHDQHIALCLFKFSQLTSFLAYHILTSSYLIDILAIQQQWTSRRLEHAFWMAHRRMELDEAGNIRVPGAMTSAAPVSRWLLRWEEEADGDANFPSLGVRTTQHNKLTAKARQNSEKLKTATATYTSRRKRDDEEEDEEVSEGERSEGGGEAQKG